MKTNRKSLTAFLMMLLFLLFTGCSGGSGSGSIESGGTGTLSLWLTDATTLEYRAVYVTIDRVDVHLGGNEHSPNRWKTVAQPKTTYNLLELVNGLLAHLSLTDLEAGLYTQMRLIIGLHHDGQLNILNEAHPSANYIVLRNPPDPNSPYRDLFVPSGVQTGIKLVEEFTIHEGETTELILDFDAARSVVKAGNNPIRPYILKPTIKVLHTAEVSSIEGYVADEDGVPLAGTLVSVQTSNPEASDPRDEVIFESSSRTRNDGWFKILVRPNTTYNVVAYKDKYDFSVACGVVVGVNVPVDVGTFQLASLETDTGPAYGDVEVSVTVTGEKDVTVSFRVPGCDGMIEVASVKLGTGTEDLILPAGTYEVVAWTEEKGTMVDSIEVESGLTADLNINM